MGVSYDLPYDSTTTRVVPEVSGVEAGSLHAAAAAWARQGRTLRPVQHNLRVLKAEQAPDRPPRLPAAAAETAFVAAFAAALEIVALGFH